MIFMTNGCSGEQGSLITPGKRKGEILGPQFRPGADYCGFKILSVVTLSPESSA